MRRQHFAYRNEDFSNGLLKLVTFSFLSQMTFLFLFVYTQDSWQLVQFNLPKFEVTMDIWFVENLIFVFSGVFIRYAN
jgi:hypothetical protein